MLKHRLISGSVLLLVVVGVFYLDYLTKSHWAFFGLLTIITVLALYEFYKMHENVYGPINKTFPLVFFGLLITSIQIGPGIGSPPDKILPDTIISWLPVIIIFLICVYSFATPVVTGNISKVRAGYLTLISFVYIVIPLIGVYLFCLMLGQRLIIYLIVLNKVADTAAYFGGKILGGRIFHKKLAPNISPNKTIEGLIAALVLGIIITIGANYFLGKPITYLNAIITGFIITFFGQLGDLVGSAIKRHCGVKDSGNWLPGLGGVLDLIDSVIFSASLVWIGGLFYVYTLYTIPCYTKLLSG